MADFGGWREHDGSSARVYISSGLHQLVLHQATPQLSTGVLADPVAMNPNVVACLAARVALYAAFFTVTVLPATLEVPFQRVFRA